MNNGRRLFQIDKDRDINIKNFHYLHVCSFILLYFLNWSEVVMGSACRNQAWTNWINLISCMLRKSGGWDCISSSDAVFRSKSKKLEKGMKNLYFYFKRSDYWSEINRSLVTHEIKLAKATLLKSVRIFVFFLSLASTWSRYYHKTLKKILQLRFHGFILPG